MFLNSQKHKNHRLKVVIKKNPSIGCPRMILFSDQISVFISAHITQEKFDASLMHAMPEVAAQERMVDNGTGQVEVCDS